MSNDDYTHQNYWQQIQDDFEAKLELLGLREGKGNIYLDKENSFWQLTPDGFIKIQTKY